MREAVKELDQESFPPAPSKYGSTSEPRQPREPEDSTTPTSNEGGVPDVLGQRESEAVNTLEEAGFQANVSTTRVRSSEAKDTVAAVNPDPGTVLPEGATVNVFLSNGTGSGRTTSVPDDDVWRPENGPPAAPGFYVPGRGEA